MRYLLILGCFLILSTPQFSYSETKTLDKKEAIQRLFAIADQEFALLNYETALDALKRIFEVDPLNEKALTLYYEIKIDLGSYEEALGIIAALLKKSPSREYLGVKSATALRYYFRNNENVTKPSLEELKHFYQIALLHMFILKRKLDDENFEDSRLHIRQSTKYLFLVKHFGFDPDKVVQATNGMKKVMKDYRVAAKEWEKRKLDLEILNFQGSAIKGDGNLVEVDPSIREELRYPERFEKSVFTTLSVGYIFWREKINAFENRNDGSTEGGELDTVVKAGCIGGGLENNTRSVSWALHGCFIFGKASIEQDNNFVALDSIGTSEVFGVLAGPGFYLHPWGPGYSLGTSFKILQRNINVDRDTGFGIEDENVTTVGGFLEARVKTKGVLGAAKIGYWPGIEAPVIMTEVSYQY